MKERKKLTKKNIRKIIFAAAGVAWCALMFGLAYPTWRQTLEQGREINEIESRLAHMDQWSVAGLWLEQAIVSRSQQVESKYEQLFLLERQREELFLQLARIADESGIQNFDLEEQTITEMMMQSSTMDSPDAMMDDGGTAGDMMDSGMMDGGLESRKLELESYRVRASFIGDYAKVARFIDGIRGLERALNVHSLIATPSSHGIRVNMEIDCYVQKHS